MKRILVPCDFSVPARQAYKFALDLASTSKGEVFVIHVISFPVMYESTFGVQPYSGIESEIKKIEDNANEAFIRLKKEYAPSSDISVTFFPVFDYLLPGIQRFTKEKEIDLIVMGTQGSSGLEEFLIGSNTENVVRYSAVPVIALRNAPKPTSIKKIVLPTNLELNETEFISKVKFLQSFFSATLYVLWVNTPLYFKSDKAAKAGIEDFCRHYNLTNYTIHVRNNKQESSGIIEFAHEVDADMIAIATHSRKGLSHLLTRRITESVVNHIECPIWTFVLKKK